MNITKLLTTALTGPNGLARFPRKRLRIALPTALALSVTLSACSSFGAAWSGEAPPVNPSSTALSQATPDSTTTSTTTPGLDPVPVVVASSGGPVWERFIFQTTVYNDLTSSLDPEPGVPVEISEVPSGCQASPTSGTSDSQGNFTTSLTCYGPFDYTSLVFSVPPNSNSFVFPTGFQDYGGYIGFQAVARITVDHAHSNVPYVGLKTVPIFPITWGPSGCSWNPPYTYTDSSGSATLTVTCSFSVSEIAPGGIEVGTLPSISYNDYYGYSYLPDNPDMWPGATPDVPFWGPDLGGITMSGTSTS
jgi:hypothetical protein